MRISGEEETHGHIVSLTQPYPQPQARAPLGQAAPELLSLCLFSPGCPGPDEAPGTSKHAPLWPSGSVLPSGKPGVEKGDSASLTLGRAASTSGAPPTPTGQGTPCQDLLVLSWSPGWTDQVPQGRGAGKGHAQPSPAHAPEAAMLVTGSKPTQDGTSQTGLPHLLRHRRPGRESHLYCGLPAATGSWQCHWSRPA